MIEPGLQLQEAVPQEPLWEKAPAWRNLTIAASLLTFAAIALPVILPQAPDGEIQALRAVASQPTHAEVSQTSSAAHLNSASNATAPVLSSPSPPSMAAPVSQETHSAPREQVRAPIFPHVKMATLPSLHAQELDTQPTQATLAPQAQSDRSSNVCLLAGPTSPINVGAGVVMGFDDRTTALARIQMTEAQNHGKIDPDYIENLRAHVRLANGNVLVVLVPKTLTVQIGDRVTFQGGYHNLNLPCNYVPTLITADTGPVRPSDSAAPP
jgi:hypothetical protein